MKKVVIVPDEEQISNSEVKNYSLDLDYHVKAYQKFSDDNNLDFEFTEDESHLAALLIAGLGHFNYKTEEEMGLLIFYLPEIITNRQLTYFQEHKNEYENYKQIGAYLIRKMDDDIFTDEVYGVNDIEREMIKRNKIFKEEKGHVR
ncbi:MAG TPA: hypothetical protein IAB45_06955 [Candidatus Onthousia faecavium]|nr:hypothetical protein [Candidatus Onthousia faecavium]